MTDMKLTDLRNADAALASKAWELYNQSFPACEIRIENGYKRAQQDPRFHPTIAHDDNEELLALLYYWEYDGVLYIEHLAVNPELRGKNIGSRLLNRFIEENPDKLVILEIEPPFEEIAIRRLHFYERLGFVANPYEYVHPSFVSGPAAHPHELVLMSHGRGINEEEMKSFCDFVFNEALKYID